MGWQGGCTGMRTAGARTARPQAAAACGAAYLTRTTSPSPHAAGSACTAHCTRSTARAAHPRA